MVGSHVSLYAAGQRVDGRYFLEELIGRGGSAEVYRARDEKTGRLVALKRALCRLDGVPGRRRLHLEREYHTLAQLAHPRIIEVYAYGVTSAGAYYTMELLEGSDLANAGRWAWPAACALLVDVASSLSILHSRGLLHRDVSARNVRRGRDERVKLIDFGALSSIGVAPEVVGTPPYVPPEAVQMQMLDGRADLFALGALAYYLLAGRHAYAARKLSDLRDVWRSNPLALQRSAPETPNALSQLVMELLSLDRMARPPHAAEVMRRLCAIASLPMVEDVAVSRAYMTMPVLVGRDELQMSSRKALLRLAQAQGATLLLEGAAGSGRTRALDACVLDGRLLGTHVARVDARSVSGDWTVARALCAQLFESLPAQAAVAVRPLGPWLGSFVAELRGEPAPRGVSAQKLERNALIRGLRDFVLALGERERLLLAVDDADRIDEPSLAFLAALAGHAESRSVAIVLTLDVASRDRSEISLQLLRAHAQVVEIAPLTAAQTEALLRSVFGDLAHVPLLAGRVHELAHGNPRDTIELAQHLVDRGVARYEVGAWSLPGEISEHDLPPSMASSLLTRVNVLPADARELAELTAVTELAGLTLEQYEQLCPGWQHARLFAGLQQLVTARLLLASADHYAWSQRGVAAVLREVMPPDRLRQMHARWADALEENGADPLLLVQHLLDAGRAALSIELLLRVDLRARHPNVLLLERVLEQALKLGVPKRKERELRLNLLNATVFTLDVPHFSHWGPLAIADLVQESGLELYRQLTDLPEAERLARAVTLTEQRYLATPQHERGFAVDEAITRLVRLSNAYGLMALWSLDTSLLDDFPALEPLIPLSPMVGVMRDLLQAARAWMTGSVGVALQIYTQLIARLEHGDVAGMDRVQHKQVFHLCHLLLGVLKASYGIRDTERHARVLESDALFRANAWHVRQAFHMSQGNQLEAGSCGRQADLLKLQQGIEQTVPARLETIMLVYSVRVGDLRAIGVALEQIVPLAARYEGWVPVLFYGQAELSALQGDWASALSLAERGLQLVAAGQHVFFAALASVRVRALSAHGRLDEAIAAGLAYSAGHASAGDGVTPTPLLAAALAQALSAAGRHTEAFEHLERMAAQLSALAMTGSATAYLFETAAWVALAADDAARFELWFAACALEYKKGHNSLFGARMARLFDAAHKRQMRVIQLAGLLDETGLHVTMGAEQLLLRDRFGECVDRADRAHCALSLVLSQGERGSGYLFAAADDGLVLLGGIPSDQADEAAYAFMQAWYDHLPPGLLNEHACETAEIVTEPEASATQTELTYDDSEEPLPARLLTSDGREYEPIALLHSHEGRALVGAFLLEVGRGTRVMPTRTLLTRIAELLYSHGDVPVRGC